MLQGLLRWISSDPGDGMEARYINRLKTMAQTAKERQEALRARRLLLGMTEVRGIYLAPDLHAELKAHARKLAKRAAKAVVAAKPPQDERD